MRLVLLPMPQRVMYVGGMCEAGALGRVEAVVDAGGVGEGEGYELVVGKEGVRIVGHDEAGVFYGRQTLRQIVAQAEGGKVQCVRIRDWPDMGARGVMLDISRDKVPTMGTLKGLVELLASWKINQLQLYMEHTFAYPGHEVVWGRASALTAEEVRELDAYCRERFVELVPNQNSFGHMHRWLMHPEYKYLAETPEGVDDPLTQGVKEPFSLCATEPRAVAFLAGLYDALLPNFGSGLFNVGCDETFDLGMGRSAEACAERGKGRVYLEFLKKIHGLVTARGKKMMFWADIIHQHPELVGEVPKDAIAMEWNYWEFGPFEARCGRLKEAGLPFYVCPGTSTWNSFVGATTNMVGNIRAAAHLGQRAGAAGLLNTDWGDHGHMQPLAVSYLGYACGAAMSWGYVANQPVDLAEAVGRFGFGDEAGVMGKAAWDLGNTYLHSGTTWLFGMMVGAGEGKSAKRFAKVNVESMIWAREHVRACVGRLGAARPAGEDGKLCVEELRYGAALAEHMCNLGIARWTHEGEMVGDLPAGVRRELAAELEGVMGMHRRMWLARNREGGRVDSVGRLEKVMRLYGGG